MSFSKSFGKGALEAFRGLVTSFKELTKGTQETSKGFRVFGVDLVWGLRGRNRPGKARRFVILIFIKYTGWYRESKGAPVGMQLNSVENDLVEVLDHLHYRHDDTETMWSFLTDFDLEYTDETGNTKRLKRTNPTKEAILDALEEAGETPRSGLVYFGGHGEYGPPGASVLDTNENGTLYKFLVQEEALGSNNSFLLAIDGGRIYGEDIISRLPEKIPAQCRHTVALDACNSSGLINAAGNLPYRYNGEPSTEDGPTEVLADPTDAQQRSSKQLVFISAAREGEVAKTVCPEPGGKEFGALTWYMLHYLKKYPYATAETLSKRLRHTCAERAESGKKQHPEIWARHPLTGSFELLPRLMQTDEDERSETELPGRGFPRVQTWFRMPHLHSASMRRVPPAVY